MRRACEVRPAGAWNEASAIDSIALEGDIAACAVRALTTPLDEIGSCTVRADIAGMRHAMQHTRLFRSSAVPVVAPCAGQFDAERHHLTDNIAGVL